jgi:aminoglycoside phosphotransferase (APT) family kinase protein
MRTGDFDPHLILRALGAADGASVARVSGGWDTMLWRVERAEAVYALRVFRPEQTETCRREVLAMRAAAARGVPVPVVHGEALWRDHPALLLSWCDGRPLIAELLARPWRAWTLGVAFGQVQARIHSVAAPEGLRGWDAAWRRWLGQEEEALLEHLRALAPRSGRLLHLDYHPLNVTVDGRRVTGVLDWANAAVGDPRLDVARTITILRLAPAPPSSPRRLTALLRRLLELGWRRGYQQAGGPLGDLTVFYAAAGAIMERDLMPKVGQPGVWLESSHIDQVRHWTTAWKRRLGAGR